MKKIERKEGEREAETKETIKIWPQNSAVKFRGKPQHDVEDGLGGLQPRLGSIRNSEAEVMYQDLDGLVGRLTDLKNKNKKNNN